jgi:hypothetical protein
MCYPYDQGFIAIENLAQSVEVKGRGGTLLQPCINRIEEAQVFP